MRQETKTQNEHGNCAAASHRRRLSPYGCARTSLDVVTDTALEGAKHLRVDARYFWISVDSLEFKAITQAHN
ncbi:MAG: hypothetical protein L6244_04240 [Candidatus Methanoperedenaceae archaeon]|nr:hypothetical protein [Candidatus Methanoperedenaceae archaeon]